jgi:hypothetical protein
MSLHCCVLIPINVGMLDRVRLDAASTVDCHIRREAGFNRLSDAGNDAMTLDLIGPGPGRKAGAEDQHDAMTIVIFVQNRCLSVHSN